MKNVTMQQTGDKLIITVDLTRDFGLSASGKTIIIASTGGNKPTPGGNAVVGLNVYRYPERS